MFPRAFFSLIFLYLLLSFNFVKAGNGTSTGSGIWTTPATWFINGATRVPTCGDTITILTGDTVTVNSQISLTACVSSLYIIVDSAAVFQFTNGNKLDLPCGSTVLLRNTGILKKSTAGGGNSTLISICDTVEWKAGDGTITGPDTLHRGTSLPVLWLDVSAAVDGNNVDIYWSTAAEINNNYFTVEKTADGVTFETIGKVAGAGNSTEVHYYSLQDEAPYTGISYYRVKQTDYDGNISYSRLVPVNFNGTRGGDIKFFPNPSSGKIYIAIPEAGLTIYTIRIFDISGREVLAPVSTGIQKNNLLTLDLSPLANGIYTIEAASEFEMKRAKVVKQ